MWRELNSKYSHFIFHARWLKHNQLGTLDSPENARGFWQEDVEDIRNSDRLLIYGTIEEHLRGALVEVGVAISWGVPVLAVGNHPDFGTWQWHPVVNRYATIPEAVEALRI